jgi:hypothetical protein
MNHRMLIASPDHEWCSNVKALIGAHWPMISILSVSSETDAIATQQQFQPNLLVTDAAIGTPHFINELHRRHNRLPVIVISDAANTAPATPDMADAYDVSHVAALNELPRRISRLLWLS